MPRFLLTRREAAQALGMSLSHFQRHVQPHLRCVSPASFASIGRPTCGVGPTARLASRAGR